MSKVSELQKLQKQLPKLDSEGAKDDSRTSWFRN